MTTTPFEHSPLNPADPRAIQILELLPSRDLEGPVHCELRHCSLDDDVRYEAVSYTWGKPEPGHTVFINGSHTLDVTPNCLETLKSFRQKFRRRKLWVDAICIDQRDNDTSKRERDRQVRIMGDVYSKAQKVLAWLGPAESTSAQTMSRMKLVSKIEAVGRFTGISILSTEADHRAQKMIQYSATSTEDPHLKPEYQALESMIHSPWTNRVWTLQEQVLARQCQAYLGRQCVSMSSLQGSQASGAIDAITDGEGFFIHELRHFVHTFCRLYDAAPPRDRQWPGSRRHNEPIAKLLLDCVFLLDATQPKDKIYGLYGILTAYCNLPLPAPDYSKPAEEVFEETVWTWINTRGDLGILKLASRPEPVHELPSWVPAWHEGHPKFDRYNPGSAESSRYNRVSHFNWNYYDEIEPLLSERLPDQRGDFEDTVPVARVLSPGKLCILHARVVGRVSHAIGPQTSVGEWRNSTIDFLYRHLDWCRILRDVVFTSIGREEAIHEMFRSIHLPGPFQQGPEKNTHLEDIFQRFRAWFDFLSYLIEESGLSTSSLLEVTDADHDRALEVKLYREVCAAWDDIEKATDVLENGYRGEVQGRESLETLAWNIQSTKTSLRYMRNHSLCILDNDSMIAVTDYWCQEGDEVFIFPGTDSPFVLRREPDGDCYRLVGPALVDRLLRVGYQKWRSEGDDLQDIVLI